MEEGKMAAEEAIENGTEKINVDALTEDVKEQSSENKEELIRKMLADDLKRCRENDIEWNTSLLLSTVLFMLEENIPVSVPAKYVLDEDGKLTVKPVALKERDGLFMAIQTVPDDSFEVSITLKIRKLFETVNDDAELTGIVINPFTDNARIPRRFVIAAMYIDDNATCETEKSTEEWE